MKRRNKHLKYISHRAFEIMRINLLPKSTIWRWNCKFLLYYFFTYMLWLYGYRNLISLSFIYFDWWLVIVRKYNFFFLFFCLMKWCENKNYKQHSKQCTNLLPITALRLIKSLLDSSIQNNIFYIKKFLFV